MVLIIVVQFIRKLMHYITKYHWVQVLSKNVEKIPVTHFTSSNDCVDVVSTDEPESHAHHVYTHTWWKDDDEPVDQGDESEDAEDNKPEPEEYVDFFINYI